jgi:hypothetical protein
MEKSIKDWCIKFNLLNYEITDEGIVNVDGSVSISDMNLAKIPIQFGIVKRHFACSYNSLTSLEGSPKKVGIEFNCNENSLTNLIGAPREVGRCFNAQHNRLISLEGGPLKLGLFIYLLGNPIFEEYKKYNNYQHYMRSIKLKQLLCKNDQ